MADIQRTAEAVWNGELRGGSGSISSQSGTLDGTEYTFATRFEQAKGTNPEELIAAAHAACFSMAFAATLGREGHSPTRIQTRATCTLAKQESGFRITSIRLETTGRVEGIDQATFESVAREAEQGCPVSNALRGGVEISVEARLES